LVSPPYWAVIECVPVERLEFERVATPLVLSVEEPRGVLPSENVTVPVGVTVPEVGVTVAVNVTICARREGFGEEVSEVAVPIKLTFCVKVEEVPPL
jgi:hypothetical protein